MDKPIILLDFDETLYRKDSLITFHLFCIRKYPILFMWLPLQMLAWILNTLKLISTQQFKNCYLVFLAFRSIESIQQDATLFWEQEFPKNFNIQLLELIQQFDSEYVVITASPTIYITPLLSKLPTITLMGTELKTKNEFYIINGKNCKGVEKINAFKKKFPHDVTVSQAYSDSLSDKPILELAQQGFIVKGDLITRYTS